MRKFAAALLALLMMTGVCYGAVSDDVYVRKDVFDAKMEALFNMLHGDIQALSERMNRNFETLSARMDSLEGRMSDMKDSLERRMSDMKDGLEGRMSDMKNSLETRMSDMKSSLEGQISGLHSTIEGRIGDLRNDIYLGLVILGIVVGLPVVQKMFKSLADRKKTITLEDVMRLIEENNAKLLTQLQK